MKVVRLLALLLIPLTGCRPGGVPAVVAPPSTTTTSAENDAMLTLRDFITLDRSEALYRKHGAEDLKDTMAFLGSSLLLEIDGGRPHELIPRETPLGVRRSELFTTARDQQSMIDLTLVADADVGSGKPQKKVRVGVLNVSPRPAGIPRIEITFEIGGTGSLREELTMWATDLDSGTRLRVQKLPQKDEK